MVVSEGNMSCTVSAVNPHGFRVMLAPEGDFHPKHSGFSLQAAEGPEVRGTSVVFALTLMNHQGCILLVQKYSSQEDIFFSQRWDFMISKNIFAQQVKSPWLLKNVHLHPEFLLIQISNYPAAVVSLL